MRAVAASDWRQRCAPRYGNAKAHPDMERGGTDITTGEEAEEEYAEDAQGAAALAAVVVLFEGSVVFSTSLSFSFCALPEAELACSQNSANSSIPSSTSPVYTLLTTR